MNRREFLKALGHVVAGSATAGAGIYQYGLHIQESFQLIKPLKLNKVFSWELAS